MIAVICLPLKKSVESSIAQTTTANGALNPGCREAAPHALDASFAALKTPGVRARGFFSSRGLSPAPAGNVLSDASQEAASWALFLWRQPSHRHGTFDDVPLNPVASWAAKRSQVVAQRARLNRRQLHWRTASRALRALVQCVEHMRSSTMSAGALPNSLSPKTAENGSAMEPACRDTRPTLWSISLTFQKIRQMKSVRNGLSELWCLG